MLTGLRLDTSNLLSTDPGLRLSHDVSHRMRADLGHHLNLSLGCSYSPVAGHGLDYQCSRTLVASDMCQGLSALC